MSIAMFWVLIDREKKVKEEVSSRGESLKEEESYDKPTTPFSEVGFVCFVSLPEDIYCSCVQKILLEGDINLQCQLLIAGEMVSDRKRVQFEQQERSLIF
jgi:hypothetical protein